MAKAHMAFRSGELKKKLETNNKTNSAIDWMFGQKLNTKLLIHCLYYSFVKIRISNSNLNIEKGRYLNTPAEDRICKLCNSGVEDEFHFTIICSKLQSCEEFFKDICDVVPSFINMSDFDKFKFIFSSNDLDICKMCILGVNKLYSLNQFKKQD